MPPRLPLSSTGTPSPFCLQCLQQSLSTIQPVHRAAFSSSSRLAANPPKKKGAVAKPIHRQGRTLRLSKGKREGGSGRPPAVGERKAFRKRVVLSNTNALEVPNLKELGASNVDTGSVRASKGQVLAFANESVDNLRALEGFKPTQGWSQFRRPATLVREETVQLAEKLDEASLKKTVREVIHGPRGSGKSVLQLQGLALASLRGFVIIHIPEARDIVNAHTSYEPVETAFRTLYSQPHYTAQLLANVARANHHILSKLQLGLKHELPIPIQQNITLQRFAELGASDTDISVPVWRALWLELTATSSNSAGGLQRPPLYISMDGADHAMRDSAYLNSEAKPIHAHDLTLINDFVSVLSGKRPLPNGGMVVAALSESNRASTPTLDFCLARIHARRQGEELQKPDAFLAWDERIFNAILAKGLSVKRLSGLTKEEAKGVMEYYAQSGVMRASVTPGLIGEKWSLAGGGIIGELEKAAVSMRF
ncbi:hypothetical protein K431DRAFT_270255 [Polychaeton citri CBS 116435]|uniref:Small ribosomal subunit protein mS29 n=1 Tax=Polychaeton citri CBS 116435 TaxID=1314669 RepID=A0A9P4Q7H4_9PEZI|nr:hypothetical protein K431DRAFT_270255 [Polychaeton citri CBS 116435]